MQLAVAPCSWGIEDASNPDNAPWKTVLEQASSGGYRGLELGPYGYLPQDTATVNNELEKRQLSIVAGTLYDDLVSESNKQNILDKTEVTCKLLSGLKKNKLPMYLVIIDQVNEVRNKTAGRPDEAIRLNSHDWKGMIDHIKSISDVAASYGVRPVIHPHAGGNIEFDDETERVVNDIREEQAGLCLDAGHLYYAGDDPAESLLKYASRLDYVHFKDIQDRIYKKAVAQGQGFFDACLEGVMCSIGRGSVDYRAVKNVLDRISYRGWVTIEQERDPLKWAGVLKDISDSRHFLETMGFRS